MFRAMISLSAKDAPASRPITMQTYDLAAGLSFILDPSKRLQIRALRYYEFCVALAYCQGRSVPKDTMETDGGFSIYVPARILRIARLYAVMQLLGELTAAIHHDVDGYSLEAFVTSIANPDSSDLLLQFLRDDGWRASNRLPGAMAFQIEINRRWAFFEEVAPLLDFSINADVSRLTGTQRVGITTAKQALTELAEEDRESGRKRPRWQNVSVSYATMGRRWKTFKSVSIFSYYQN
jgi:hypothetical protein